MDNAPQTPDGKEKLELLKRLRKRWKRPKYTKESRNAGAWATRQQFLEATRNVGVIVFATCFTAGWLITNPNVKTDNVSWGVAFGLLLIFAGSFGYGYIERSKIHSKQEKSDE